MGQNCQNACESCNAMHHAFQIQFVSRICSTVLLWTFSFYQLKMLSPQKAIFDLSLLLAFLSSSTLGLDPTTSELSSPTPTPPPTPAIPAPETSTSTKPPQAVSNCPHPFLIPDPSSGICTSSLGQPCRVDNASFPCPLNSLCALVNFQAQSDQENSYSCACIYTHYATQNGTCAPLPSIGEECDPPQKGPRKCRGDSDLICREGRCACPLSREHQFFDASVSKCVAYAGRNCTQYCVPNASCDFWGSGKCQCRVDHRAKEGKCEPIPPGYLSPCPDSLCNKEAGLACIDSVCQCSHPLHQVYDFQLDACIGLAGDLCTPSQNSSRNCVRNSACSSTSSGSAPTCTCLSGYSTTPFRKCMKGHSSPCGSPEDPEPCNVFRGLACINGTCACYDEFLQYDSSSGSCLSREGSPCGKVFLPFPSLLGSCQECDAYYFACSEGLQCSRDLGSEMQLQGALEKFRCRKGS